MGTKFETREQLCEFKKDLDSKYESGLPEYLQDYFDQEEKKLEDSEFFKNLAKIKYETSSKDKEEYKKNRDKEFWENNKTRIYKYSKGGNPKYEEPPKAEERLEQEKELSQDEVNTLIDISESDIELFAMRYYPHYLKRPSSKFHKFLYHFLSRTLGKKKKRHRGFKKAIASPRSNAKCLKRGTLIQLSDGSLKKIEELKPNTEIVSLDTNFKLCFDKVVLISNPEMRKVVDIKLRSGRTLSLTEDHRLFSIEGCKPLSELSVGERIATPRKLKCNIVENTMSLDEAIFLANMLAEGCLVKGRKLKKSEGYSFKTGYTNFDKEVVEEFSKSCNNLGFELKKAKKEGHYSILNATEYFRKHNLGGHSALTKKIPEEVFKQNNDFLKIFLSRFIATDGWVTKHNPCFGITLANEALIDQLFIILLRLGFLPVKQVKPNKKSGAWAVVCHGCSQLERLSKIGILHKQPKLLKTIEKFKEYGNIHANLDLVPFNWRKYLKNTSSTRLRKDYKIRIDNKYNTTRKKVSRVADIDNNEFLKDLANSDIYWDEIISISEEYDTETYDVQTENTENFIANNIFSHNSSIISGILPLWCTCYNKKKFIIIISDSANQAEEFLEDIKRELLHNEILARDFPHVVGKGAVWKRGQIITRNDVQILALGSGSRVRGRKYGKNRPDLIILDDVENDEMVRSQTTREFIRYQWFNKGVLHVGEAEGSDVDFLFVGTINGKECLLNALLDPSEYPDWESDRFQAVEQFPINLDLWDEWEDVYKDRFNKNRKEDAWNFYLKNKESMNEGAKILWPEGDPLYGLMVNYISDPSGFESEKQNNPLDPSRVLTPIDQLTFIDFRDAEIQQVLNAKTTDFYGSLDPSLGKNATSDFSCLTSIARCKKSGYIFVVDFDIKRRKVDKQVEAVLKKYEDFCKKRWGHKLIVCETNLFQIVLKDNIAKESRRRQIYAPIEGVENYSDKHARIESIVPLIKDGTIIFDKHKYETNQQYALAVDQIAEYYEGVSHDDAYDSLEMAVRVCKKKRFRMIAK